MKINEIKRIKIKKKIRYLKTVFIFMILFFMFFIIFEKVEEEAIVELEPVISEIAAEDKYIIKIDYPIIENEVMHKKIKEYIDSQKEEFLNMVSKLEARDDFKYDFIAQNQVFTLEDITTVYVLIYYYTGGNHYIRLDKTYHYNEKTNEEIDITYFLKDDNSLQKLSSSAYYYVMKFAENEGRTFNESFVKIGTEPIIENYSHFSFRDDGLKILFPPYQVASWADGEIEIMIPYSELHNIVKDEYIKLATQKEECDIVVPAKRDLKQFEGKKLIAFTFDDGPNPTTTNELLKGLDKYNAKVTFFVLGSRALQFKSTIKDIYEKGHQIGSHTYNHLNLLNLNEYQIMKEIIDTNKEIEKIIGVQPTLIRPPFGNTNKEIRKMSNMNTILWDVDTLDWKTRNAEKVEKEILSNAHDGAIILLHDIYGTSIKGALSAMEKLEKEGYAFVTIEEMAELRTINLDTEKIYYNFKSK